MLTATETEELAELRAMVRALSERLAKAEAALAEHADYIGNLADDLWGPGDGTVPPVAGKREC